MRTTTASKRLRALLTVICLAVGTLALVAPAAEATTLTLRGTVKCNSGRSVVGIWIESSAGGSGWASFTRLPGDAHVAYYSRNLSFSGSSTKTYPTVGCGGSSSRWASSSKPKSKTISKTYVYNVSCADPRSGNGSCVDVPFRGDGRENWFEKGYCTWGAAELWKKATGKYPYWNGHAKYWNDNAAAAGFAVGRVPRERSIAVFENSSSGYGHVAWVTRVWVSGSSIRFHVREMNYTGWNRWSDRDVTFGSGMSFILAPSGYPVTS